MKRHRTTRAGFSVLEMMIGLGILSTLIAGTTMMVGSTRSAYESSTLAARAAAEARRTVSEIAERLRAAGAGTLNPVPGPVFGTPVLSFNAMLAEAGGGAGWGAASRVVLELDPAELDDGLDDDGDGLVDERQIVLVPDVDAATPQRIVLCTEVTELFAGETRNGEDDNANGLIDEPGLCFSLDGGILTVRVSVAAALAGEAPVVRASELSLRLKN